MNIFKNLLIHITTKYYVLKIKMHAMHGINPSFIYWGDETQLSKMFAFIRKLDAIVLNKIEQINDNLRIEIVTQWYDIDWVLVI